MKPYFSVIIPTRDRVEFLKKAINSVLHQSFTNFELIVVDDASKDESQDYLKQLSLQETRLKILKNSGCGVSSSRNLGIQAAQGKFISFLDSDDEWLPQKLDEDFQASKNHCWIHCDEMWIRRGTRVNSHKKHQKAGGNLFLRSLELCLVSPSCVTLAREILLKNLFDETLTVCEDYDLWLRLFLNYEIFYIDQKLVRKNGGHADQLSNRYVAMDLFRVASLLKMKESESMSLEQSQGLEEVLTQKIKILKMGFAKNQRDFHFNTDSYQAFLSDLKQFPLLRK